MDKDKIADTIIKSKNYKNICKETVLRFCEEESKKYKSEKMVVKSVKNRIHQVHGAFLSDTDHKNAFVFLSEMEDCSSKDSISIKEMCLKILNLHASTQERINTYDDFYKEIFSVTGYPKSILDIACGFNPFSIPWMELKEPAEYYAVDINSNTIDVLNKFFEIIKWPGTAICQDVIYSIPNEEVDVAFLFKLLPLIEQQKKGYSLEILRGLNAKYIIVSFPVKSMSGKNKGMYGFYSDFFKKLIDNYFSINKEILLGNELIYIISKGN